MITLKELAKELKVSVSTVSKALHDSPEISVQTIEKVKKLAKKRNYKPNKIALSLKSNKESTCLLKLATSAASVGELGLERRRN